MQQIAMPFAKTFDARLGVMLKEAGLDLVEEHGKDFVQRMKIVARLFCLCQGNVCADDLRKYADENHIEPHHQNAWGAIFHGKQFRMVGRRNSAYPRNHAREIKVWELVL